MGTVRHVLLFAVGVTLAISGASSIALPQDAPRLAADQLPQIRNFALVGWNALINLPGSRGSGSGLPRGMNAAMAVAKTCAYVGSRNGLQDVLILDVANPRNPVVTGSVAGVHLSSSRELRAIEDLDLLVIENFRLDAGVPTDENPTNTSGAVSHLRIYNIANCQKPALRTDFNFRTSVPHEFFLWRDPKNPRRVLAYVSFITGDLPDLRVIDLSDAERGVRPKQVASFTLNPAVAEIERVNLNDPRQRFADDQFPFRAIDLSDRVDARFLFLRRFGPQPLVSQTNRFHSMTVNPEGTRIFVANLHAGFFILDSSNLADEAKARSCVPDTVTADVGTNRNPNLCLRKLNPDPNARVDWHPPYPGFTAAAVQIPGRPYVLVGDVRNGTTTCPWSWYRIVDITSEADPALVPNSDMLLSENKLESCRSGAAGDPKHLRDFSAFDVTAFRNLGFFTWHSGGLRVWDYANPSAPREVGIFVPKPVEKVQFPFRDSPDVWVWGQPILKDGLIYFIDIRNGLFTVEYRGPRRAELPRRGIYTSDMTIVQR